VFLALGGAGLIRVPILRIGSQAEPKAESGLVAPPSS